MFFDFLRLPPICGGDGDGDCDGNSSGTTTLFLLELTAGSGDGGGGALTLGTELALGAFAPGIAGFANQLPILL